MFDQIHNDYSVSFTVYIDIFCRNGVQKETLLDVFLLFFSIFSYQ